MKVSVSELRVKVVEGVEKLGYKGGEAATIVDTLLYAELRGNNQGIAKIATGGVPKASDVKPCEVVKSSRCAALISGGHSMVATSKAAMLAIDLARDHGIGIVGSVHAFSSSGSIGYFSKQIAEAGFIGMIFRGTPPFVVPHGSTQAVLGTNPLSYAFPTRTKPVVFDMASSVIAGYGVIEAKLTGTALAEGIAYDKDGKPTTNAADVWPDGSITTFGGYKGFGLSLLIQLLGGPFVGGAFAGLHSEQGPGTVVMAIDPGLFVGIEQYLDSTDELVDAVSLAKPIRLEDQILLPGERGDQLLAAIEAAGEIEIADEIWQQLQKFIVEA